MIDSGGDDIGLMLLGSAGDDVKSPLLGSSGNNIMPPFLGSTVCAGIRASFFTPVMCRANSGAEHVLWARVRGKFICQQCQVSDPWAIGL